MTATRASTSRRGPQPTRSRPNPALLILLALVAVAAIGRLAVGSLSGGGTIRSFAPIVLPRTLTHKAGAPPASGSQTVLVGRPARDPFAPAPGFAR